MKVRLSSNQIANLKQYAPQLARTRLHDGVFFVPKCWQVIDFKDCFGEVDMKEVE